MAKTKEEFEEFKPFFDEQEGFAGYTLQQIDRVVRKEKPDWDVEKRQSFLWWLLELGKLEGWLWDDLHMNWPTDATEDYSDIKFGKLMEDEDFKTLFQREYDEREVLDRTVIKLSTKGQLTEVVLREQSLIVVPSREYSAGTVDKDGNPVSKSRVPKGG